MLVVVQGTRSQLPGYGGGGRRPGGGRGGDGRGSEGSPGEGGGVGGEGDSRGGGRGGGGENGGGEGTGDGDFAESIPGVAGLDYPVYSEVTVEIAIAVKVV